MTDGGRREKENTLRKLSGKWKLDILYCLIAGKNRWNVLVRAIPEAAPNVLTRQLRKLEADGLVARQVLNARPPYVVEYALTETGRELIPVIQALAQWDFAYACEKAG